jgi:pimeloyl-ACP methyl ester carboxylesterase
MTKHYVVIVLGLGEAVPLYAFLTRRWQTRYGLTPILYTIGWKDTSQPFAPKLARLVRHVQRLASDGKVSLVGVSAGASATLNAYVALKEKNIPVHSYVSICGRFDFSAHPWYPPSYGIQRVPAFEASVILAMKNISQLTSSERTRMSCFYSLFDEIVPLSASTLTGCSRLAIPLIQHHTSIYGLLFSPGRLIAKLKAV